MAGCGRGVFVKRAIRRKVKIDVEGEWVIFVAANTVDRYRRSRFAPEQMQDASM